MQNKNNNKEDGKQKIEFKTLNVFGPRIGYVQLPKDVVARMMTITKDAIEDKEKVKRNLCAWRFFNAVSRQSYKRLR